MNVSPLKIVLAMAVWSLVMALSIGFYLWHWLYNPRTVQIIEPVFIIEKGATLHSVAKRLHEEHLIRWPDVWVVYGRIFHLENIKAGEYRLEMVFSPVELLQRFQKSEHVQHPVTLVEGLRLRDFVSVLHQQENLVNTLGQKTYPELAQVLNIPEMQPEGYFYPDTYQYIRGDADKDILLRAYWRMKSVLSEEWEQRAEGLPYSSPYEALIMASIIEKETGVGYERAEIAGVFVRRLQKKMRLQTDPTVIYGLGDAYDGNLRRVDLKTPTEYNTYTISGLPPTPIANPGREAIHAALHPAAGTALYFVAKGDGSHYFSSTLQEHEAAVQRFQKQRRSDYRSSPALPTAADQTPEAGGEQ
ncbi:conserved hypothetical protein [Teredinibacter turnerae T7901]|uniref:Endolytic murein transglycosylase n=1 Tax=Teredinibacter turnerae (strain ATCC 39867 / T7901) TaxID=377629 RepID=C5BU63_TERTT|nr:endolytic transglycosylase MltG [Teredinibacter turnerae]ACR12214.1 conserved hypothetical protein [Teredinibacter turnerae T7901]